MEDKFNLWLLCSRHGDAVSGSYERTHYLSYTEQGSRHVVSTRAFCLKHVVTPSLRDMYKGNANNRRDGGRL